LRGDEVLRVTLLGFGLSGSGCDAAARVRRSEEDPHPERHSKKEREHGREAGGAAHGATLDQDRCDASPYAMSDCGRRSSSGRHTRARSEERRVGEEGRTRRATDRQEKKKGQKRKSEH